MIRLFIGSLVAAAATFMLGFVFFATPVSELGYKTATIESQKVVQDALRTLGETGTFYLPDGKTPEAVLMHETGPTAVVKVNMQGSAPSDVAVLVRGFVHMTVSMLLLGLFLWVLRNALPTFASRVMPLLFLAAVAAVWTRLGEPIWWRTDWANAFYSAATDFVSLAVGGLIMALFVPRARRT
ncbi:MAG: hypothetical protein KGZ61_01780 [Sandarakinorhabdus sp.]|nr:hypothetical protein [Sandarakinorhabdus sp.]